MDARRLENWFFVALLVGAVFLVGFILKPYLAALVLAGTLGFVFRPLYKKFLKILRNDFFAALGTVFVVAVIVFVPLGFLGVRIFSEATALYVSLTLNGGIDFGGEVARFMSAIFGGAYVPEISVNLNNILQQGLAWLIQNIGTFFSGLAQAIFVAFLSLLGLFYFFKDGERLREWLLKLSPLEPKYTEQIIEEMGAVVSAIVKGALIVAIVDGIATGAGFVIFNVPNPVLWASFAVLLSLLPIVGPMLIAVPAVAYLFFIGQAGNAIGLAIWSIIVLNLNYNLLAPQLMKRGADTHPLIMLLSVLGGISLFGPIGFIVGPLAVAFLLSLLQIYPKLILKKGK